MERESFLLYRSFTDLIKEFPKDEQLEALWAVIDYGLDGIEHEKAGLAKGAFLSAKPQIDANNKRWLNAQKGGAPKGAKNNPNGRPKQEEANQELTKNKPKTDQELTKNKPNVNVNVNENVNVNNNLKIEQTRSANALFEKVWSIYPEKKGKARVSDKDKRKLLEIGYEHIERAIDRYKKEITESDFKHYQHGSTFFHSGIYDYLDDSFTKSTESELNKAHEKPTFKPVEEKPANALAYKESVDVYQAGTPMPFERSLASEMLRRKREKKA